MAAKKTVKAKEEEVVEVQAVEEEVEAAEVEEKDGFVPEELIGPDGEELLFAGGPPLSKLEEWKSQFKDEVYLSEFDDEVFIWRPMSRKEYKQVMKIQSADSYYKEERICETAVLYPENYNFMQMTNGKAGIPTLIAEYVMAKSGFEARTAALKL